MTMANPFWMGGADPNLYSGNYHLVNGRSSYSATSQQRQFLAPGGGTVTKITLWTNTAQTAGKGWNFTFRVNDIATDATLALTGADLTASATFDPGISFSTGDRLNMYAAPTGGPAAATVHWAVEYVPTNSGETYHSGCLLSLTNAATYYLPPKTYMTNQNVSRLVMPCASHIKGFNVWLSAGPGAGSTRTFTLCVNGSAKPVNFTIGESDQYGYVACDVAVNARDTVYVRAAWSGTTVATADCACGISIAPDVSNSQPLFMVNGTANLSNTATQYAGIEVQGPPGSGEAVTTLLRVPYDVTLKTIAVVLTAAPGSAGSGASMTFTVRKEMADTALSKVMLETLMSSDYSTDVSVAAGEGLSLSNSPSVSPAPASTVRACVGVLLDLTTAAAGTDYTETVDDGLGVTDVPSGIGVLARLLEQALGLTDALTVVEPGNDFSADTDCVALYRFESGALNADSKGSNTLTDNGIAASTADKKEGGACGDFAGVSSKNMVLANAGMASTFPFKSDLTNDKMTVCGWFKVDTYTNNACLFIKGATGHLSLGLMLFVATGNKLSWWTSTDGTNKSGLVCSPAMYTGRWYHFGATYDNATHTKHLRVWDDTAGSVIYSNSSSGSVDVHTYASDFEIGGDPANNAFDGLVDELVVFKDILSDAEIDQVRQKQYRPAGTGYSRTFDDGIGAADTRQNLSVLQRALAAALGMTDTAGRISVLARALAATCGITDARNLGQSRVLSATLALNDSQRQVAAVMVRTIANALGLTDSGKRSDRSLSLAQGLDLTDIETDALGAGVQAWVKTVNDALDLADSQTRLSLLVRALADSMGLTDTWALLTVMQRLVTDAQGLTDGRTLQRALALAATVGSSDQLTKIVAYLRSQTATIGLTDSRTYARAVLRTMTSILGMADATSRQEVAQRLLTDAQGLTDGRTLARATAIANALDIADAWAKVLAYLRCYSDSIGLADSRTQVWTVVRTIANSLGIKDSVSEEGAGVIARVFNELLALTDARTPLHIALRVLTEMVATADGASRLFAASRLVNDAEGITDCILQGKVFAFAETVGASDELGRVLNFVRGRSDDVGVADALLKLSALLRSIDDTTGLTDAETDSLAGLIQAAWVFLLLRKAV
jgi:hypothetical protein